MNSLNQIKAVQLDVLKEIGNIGSGNAATALSSLINKTIDMEVPLVKILSFDEIVEFVGGPEVVAASIFLRIEGDISGSMYFFLSIDVAKALVSHILNEQNVKDTQNGFTEMEISVLQEVGNILSGSYLTALADFTKLNLQPSVPAFAIDMVGSLLSYGIIESGKTGDIALVIDTRFLELQHQQTFPLQGQFVLLPDPFSFPRIFESLGVPYYE